jgi:ssDNA-binding Zn-finger/Zn-ribbon topoisomerase 1
MFGQLSNFKCPCCNHTEVIRLGRTQFVNIKDKGEHLALTNCPKCNKLIAFEMVDRKSEPSFSFDVRSINEDEIENAGVICY